MLRVIFDTNIYGFLLKEENAAELKHLIRNDKNFVVYGFGPVRKELRDVPKGENKARQVRIALLELYDWLINDRTFQSSDKITKMAKEYYAQYRKSGGLERWGDIGVDFLIVACAALHNLDVVCSGDEKTLMNKYTQEVYHKVHVLRNCRTPNFWAYEDLLRRFRKRF